MAQSPKSSPAKPAAAATPAAKPAAPAAGKPAAAATTAPKAAAGAAERSKMIAEAAYFIGQKRGQAPGNPFSDWLQAEKQVDDQLRKRT